MRMSTWYNSRWLGVLGNNYGSTWPKTYHRLVSRAGDALLRTPTIEVSGIFI